MFEAYTLQTDFKNWSINVDLYEYCEWVAILQITPVAHCAQDIYIYINI